MPSSGQDAAAAAGGGAGGDDGTAASSSASRANRRKHRSRSPTKTTGSTSNSSSRSPDSLLDKVGGACEQHQKNLHDSNPTSSDNIKSFAHWRRPTMFASDETLAAAQDDMPRKCFKQMNSLCQVLIKIEETYATKLAKIDRVLDEGHRMAAADAVRSASSASASASAGDEHDSAAAAAAAAQASLEEAAREMAEQPVGWGTDDDDMLNTAKVSADLCVTYRACLRGSFCPYSLQMFGWGRGGDKVLPRVHLLLQSLLSPCVTVQTLRQISKDVRADENSKNAKKKQDADSSIGKGGSVKENMDAQDEGIDTLIDISQTIARLLRCIPERELRSATVRDLVALLYDSAVVIGPACPLPLARDVAGAFAAENGNQGSAGSGTGVRLSLFCETLDERRKNAPPSGTDDDIENRYGDDQYQVDIKSTIALLSLQRGTIRTLATLLQLHRRDLDFRVGRDEEAADEGQIEVADIEASLQSNGRRYLESASVEDAGLKDTIVAALRQVLLSPAASSSATATDHASGEVCVLRLLAKIEAVRLLQLLWEELSTLESTSQNDETTDLRLLCCQALLAHFEAMGDTPSDETLSSASSPNVRAVSNKYMSSLFGLFRDRVASSELFSTDGGVTEATRGRSMLLVPSTIKALRSSMVLSTLLQCIKYSPGVVQSSNHSPIDDEKKLCRMILRTIHILLDNPRQSSQQRSLAHSFCSANEIYPSLVSLTKEPSLAPIATAIIGNMLEQGGLVHGVNHNSVLIDACTVAWQIHEERVNTEAEKHQSEETGAHQASSYVSTREKRHKVSKSSHKKVGAASAAIPKQQLQIERSPKRKRSHTDMTSPVPQNSVLSRREFRAADSSPASSITRIIDEALIEVSNVTRDANASKKNGSEEALNSAVLSAITARSISIMGGAFNLVIRLCRGSADSIRCSAVKDTADTLLRTLTMVANAVKHGAVAPSDSRTVGPNRLKRALNVLIGVGFELHAVDGGRDEVFGEIEKATQQALKTISQCAIDVWTQGSSLLEQQRDRENDQGRATASGPAHILDSFDTSLEDRHIQHDESLSRHSCRGSCVALFSSFGVPVPDALCSRCFCSMLPSETTAGDERLGRSLANDAALFFVQLELPLSSRCLLLASICPHKGIQNRLNDEPNTLSSMRKILSTPAGEQSGVVTASALACVPFCISTNAQKPSCPNGSQIDSKNVIQMITKLGLHRSVAAIAFPPSGEGTNLTHPPALQRAAVVCLHRLLEMYASPPSIEDSGGSSLTNTVSSCVMNLVRSYSTLQNAREKSAVLSQISSAAFDLLVSPMMVSKQDFAGLPSQVRLALWKFLAFACTVCSPSQLRRSNGHSHLVSYRLAASENHPEPGEDVSRGANEGTASDTVRTPSLLWLLHAAFADEDGIVRDYAATEIGSALRLEAGCNPLFSLTLSDVEWQAWVKDPVGTSNKFTPAVVERLFREIDSLLHKFCYINESQLSYTFAGTITSTVGSTSSGGGGGEGNTYAAAQSKASMALSRQISALKALSSICRQVDLNTSLGKALFEHSLLHIVRLWISPNSSRVGVPTPVELRVPGGSVLASAAWDELCKIDRQYSLCSFLISEASMQRYTATLFSEILVGSEKQDTQDPSEIERHILALMQFIRAFLIDAIGDEIKETHAFANTRKFIPRRKDAYSDILRFVQMYFPEICATLILDKDMKALKMFCFFQRFILDEGSALRREENSKSLGEKIQGGKTWHRSSLIKDVIKKMDLNRAMIEFFAAPDFAKAALTRVLLKPQSDALYFYVRTILGDTLSLVQVFAKPYKIHVLDKIVYELGKYDIADVRKCLENGPGCSSCSSYCACFALKRLGLIQELQDKTNDDETNAIGAMKRLGAVHADASRELGLEAAQKLVTIRMMSLLVQNFMDQWSDESGLHLVRSLQALLLFVREEESPTYLTQVTQVISKAMATSSSEMHLVAVSTLSDYVQMVLKHNVKLIGDNLSNIIVTIFPVFEVEIMHRQVANKGARPLTVGSSGSTRRSGNVPTPSPSVVLARVDGASSDPFKAKTVDEAVKLLNHLVDGKVGKKLAPYFSEIPFLPSNPALEGVRSSLKKLGVDIDEVVPMSQLSTQRTQDGFTGGADRDGTASVGSFAGGDGSTRSNLGSQAQAALRRRLGVLSKLLAHENKKVRIAVLNHLTDLLRANRALFLRLVESEESVSMRFLTVIKDASPNDEAENDAEGDLASVGGGGVTELVQKLVSRCIIESDADTRLALATCLGEMGAIDSNRLGREVNATSAALLTTDSFDVSGFHGSWRLSQPPWKSQVIRYELHLVTHQLVMSLKGAKDNMGQHKVAFTIQELLKLLDESAAKLNASSKAQHAESSGARSSSSGGPGRQREMGGWLSGKLEEAGVREVLEPYWKTQYRQKELLSPRLPPFFTESGSYFGWLRDWCRYMVARAYHSKRSRWKDFFFACRSAIREDSTVCEFLLPLLVLDNLSFDDESDGGQAIIKEMLDALTFTGSTSDMPLEERTKACNAVFVILDTLSLWSEKETEERNKSSRGSSSASSSPSMSYLAGSDTEWPAEESLASIDDLLKAIPLSLCAEAAEAVGMNARSLRYLELEARSHIAGPIYDDLQVENYRRHYSNENEFHAFSKKGSLLGKTILKGVDTKVVRKVLGRLGDNSTMTAISKDFNSGFYEIQLANIQEREFHGDWEGALQMYEQALQLHEAQIQRGEADAKRESEALSLRSGMVKCLLELGQLESALNQTKGILSKGVESTSRQEILTGASRKRDRLPSYDEIDEIARKTLMPSAAEAAWRLGKWDALDDIVTSWDGSPTSPSIGRNQSDGGNTNIEDMDPRSQYGISFGQAMLGLQKGDVDSVTVSLEAARTAALQSLSGAARESYSRAYPFLLQLQCIREVEDANDLLRSSRIDASDGSFSFEAAGSSADFANLARSDSNYGWEWGGRLRMADSGALGSSSIVNTRLALSRIFDNPILEGELWLEEGKRARKSGLSHIAENSLAHADAAFEAMATMGGNLDPSLALSLNKDAHDVQVQFAKLKADAGKTTAALQLLGQERIDIKDLLGKDDHGLKEMANAIQELRTRRKKHGHGSSTNNTDVLFDENVKLFGRSLLTGTEWICESGFKNPSEILDRYELVAHRLLPRFERSHFCFAKYLDSLLTSRIEALSGDVSEGRKGTRSTGDDQQWTKMMRKDVGCQKYLLQAMEEYGRALQLGTKHVYQALPRLLSLWFEFTSIDPRPPIVIDDGGGRRRSSSSTAAIDDERVATQLENMQAEANKLVAGMVRSIPAIAFYTALPQLISRVGHRDGNTSDIVILILKRLLVKFPQQTMWSVGWLRNSANVIRAKAGEEIFRGAQKNLREKEDFKKHDLVEASKALFTFLIGIAKHKVKDDKKTFTTQQIKLRGADLSEFVPPVQAALSVLPSSIGHSRSSENFPAFVPRMRAFSTKVAVMQSKAKPKKVTVYAIPAGQGPQLRRSSSTNGHAQSGDAGEMHFLVKQEARGDLRKDARVQDLNNVINRLLSGHGMGSSSSSSSGGEGGNGAQQQRRRLHLRTFSVTCLSEDCGILEWVPNTDSLRNVVMNSYNAQADPHSTKRRGRRIGAFGDPNLRRTYDKCQDLYFKGGNLSRAVEMFDEKFLSNYPPVMYWWFIQNFLDPHSWFEARMAFTLSAATWSAVGHVIGLGDRHSENILIDTSSGGCVHVDFDCIFDKALLLPKPEVVPFRLSPNMLDAFGPVGADGAFTGGMISAMTTLRNNRDILLSVLEPFIKDPIIDWKKHRNHQKQGTKGNAGASKSETETAKRHIRMIQGRLKGVYNLENPNHKKIVRNDLNSLDQADDMTHLLPLSVEGQVQKMIAEATNIENLVQVYVGWMPWL